MSDNSSQPPAPPSAEAERSGERIAKLLARAGIASRREVERLIAEGRVRIGEDVVTTPATLLTTLKGVTVDGKPVSAPEPTRLFVFHKPAGLLTAERDPAGRPTIYTALRNALPEGTPRLMPVGRLDYSTEGLLLLTNDGELKRAMELPSSGIPRTYRARAQGAISQEQLEELIEGIEIDGVRYGRIDANLERRTGTNQWIEMTITEGKNREIRRVLEHLGMQVSRLIRVSYGPFELLDLPRGRVIEIRQIDVERFRKGIKTGAPHARPVQAQAPAQAPAQARPDSEARNAPRPAAGSPNGRPERPVRTAYSEGPRRDERPRRATGGPDAPRGAARSNPRPDDQRQPQDRRPQDRKAPARKFEDRTLETRRTDMKRPDDKRPDDKRAGGRRSEGGRSASGRPDTRKPASRKPFARRSDEQATTGAGETPRGGKPGGRKPFSRTPGERPSENRGPDNRGPDNRGPDNRGPGGRSPNGRGGPRR